jgi:hypothetical protein
VYDSGSQLEQIAKDQLADIFNSEGWADGFDTTSPDKGRRPLPVRHTRCHQMAAVLAFKAFKSKSDS